MRCASFLGALSLLAHVELVRAVPQPAAPVEQAGLVPSLVLVGPNGAANGQLVVPAAPNWMETAAAMELNLQIFKATGANLTIVHEPQAVAGTPALYNVDGRCWGDGGCAEGVHRQARARGLLYRRQR